MPYRLNSADSGFEASFHAFLAAKRDVEADVRETVAGILAQVRSEGDAALVALTRAFDRYDCTVDSIRFTSAEIDAAVSACDPAALRALDTAAARIDAFHRRQTPDGLDYVDDAGVRLGLRWKPIQRVGLYVPGGQAAYPSSLLMNAIPAKVAGVRQLAMAVPTPDGTVSPLVLAAARRAGIDEIYRIGGAQAVAALAYGTARIRPVDKIVGPGNAYVAEAKRQVFGTVGIDLIAGPSEILVVADADNDPAWIAIDLLSQAEHDTVAQAILITDNAAFAGRVEAALAAHLETLPRRAVADASWRDFGAVIVVGSLDEAPALVDRIAPEHLELAVAEPESLFARIGRAGSAFLGRYTPEAVGDYVGGPNHVLPTGRSARFSSGLGVHDFLTRTTFLACSPEALGQIGSAAVTLARAEGLEAHARSLLVRGVVEEIVS